MNLIPSQNLSIRMKIEQETLQKIAHLARLNFDTQEAEKMSADLSQVLNWVDQLQEVDTEDVAPLTNMSSEVNVLRTDEIGVQLTQEEALKNSPQQENGFFTVHKVLE